MHEFVDIEKIPGDGRWRLVCGKFVMFRCVATDKEQLIPLAVKHMKNSPEYAMKAWSDEKIEEWLRSHLT